MIIKSGIPLVFSKILYYFELINDQISCTCTAAGTPEVGRGQRTDNKDNNMIPHLHISDYKLPEPITGGHVLTPLPEYRQRCKSAWQQEVRKFRGDARMIIK